MPPIYRRSDRPKFLVSQRAYITIMVQITKKLDLLQQKRHRNVDSRVACYQNSTNRLEHGATSIKLTCPSQSQQLQPHRKSIYERGLTYHETKLESVNQFQSMEEAVGICKPKMERDADTSYRAYITNGNQSKGSIVRSTNHPNAKSIGTPSSLKDCKPESQNNNNELSLIHTRRNKWCPQQTETSVNNTINQATQKLEELRASNLMKFNEHAVTIRRLHTADLHVRKVEQEIKKSFQIKNGMVFDDKTSSLPLTSNCSNSQTNGSSNLIKNQENCPPCEESVRDATSIEEKSQRVAASSKSTPHQNTILTIQQSNLPYNSTPTTELSDDVPHEILVHVKKKTGYSLKKLSGRVHPWDSPPPGVRNFDNNRCMLSPTFIMAVPVSPLRCLSDEFSLSDDEMIFDDDKLNIYNREHSEKVGYHESDRFVETFSTAAFADIATNSCEDGCEYGSI